MTDEQAAQEAKRRWGKQGYVRHETGAMKDRFSVGVQDGVLFHAKGSGKSWKEAFAMADGKVGVPA